MTLLEQGIVVHLDENGLVKGAALQKLKLVEVGVDTGLKKYDPVKQRGIFILSIAHNGKGAGRIAEEFVGQK